MSALFYKELNKEAKRISSFRRIAHRLISAPCVAKNVPSMAETLFTHWLICFSMRQNTESQSNLKMVSTETLHILLKQKDYMP